MTRCIRHDQTPTLLFPLTAYAFPSPAYAFIVY
jgi:hypothetical protein